MARDFKASQVRTSQIIASSTLSTRPSLMILSASSPGVDYNGGYTFPGKIGGDVFLFVTGSNSFGTTIRGVTLFGGDVVISGSLYNGTGGSYGNVAGSDTQVQFNDGGNFGADSGLTYNKSTDSLTVAGDLAVNGGDITSTAATFNLVNATATTVNLGGAADVNIGASNKTATVAGSLQVNGNTKLGDASSDSLQVTANAWFDNRLNVSGSTKLGNASSNSVQITGNTWLDNNLNVSGSVTIAQNLTVNGTTTTVNTTNLVVKDPLIYFGSGTTSSNQNGGIALASGSSVANQSLVWGRVANDTWGAGRLDVTAGTTTDISGMTLVPVRASKLEAGGASTFISSSNGSSLEIGAATQVLILSGGAASSLNPRSFSDVNFFVSGSAGSKGTSTRGTAVFGGDVVISGTLHGGSPLKVSGSMALSGSMRLQTQDSAPSAGSNESVLYVLNDSGTKKLYWKNSDNVQQEVGTGGGSSAGGEGQVQYANDTGGFAANSDFSFDVAYGTLGAPSGTFFSITGSLTKLRDGTSYLIAGSNVTITTGSNGSVTIASTGGGGGSSSGTFNEVNIGGSSTTLVTTSSVSFAGEKGFNYAVNSVGADTFFFVSGVIGSRDTVTRGVAVFGGDSFVSGTQYSNGLYLPSGTNDFYFRTENGNTNIRLADLPSEDTFWIRDKNSKTHFHINTNDNGFAPEFNPTTSVNIGEYRNNDTDVYFFISGSKNSRGIDGSKGVSLFGGDVTVSGSLLSAEISGSLTKLADGTSYLIAGTGLNVITGSTGAVTVGINNSVVATVSGTAFTGDVSTQNLAVNGDATVAGNLTVNGSVTSISSSNLNVADPIIYLASGSIGPSVKSAIAFASGSTVTSQSLIIGSTGFGNTIAVAKQDVQSGMLSQSSLSFTDLTPFRAAKFEAGGFSTFISSSNASTLEISAATQVLILSGGSAASSNPRSFSDTNFFVSGSTGSKNTSSRGTAVFGGDVVTSGTIYPGTDLGANLGSPSNRWGNIYTGDLHLKNDRGDYTLIEEEDCLTIRFNKTGKRYKFVLERAPEYDE